MLVRSSVGERLGAKAHQVEGTADRKGEGTEVYACSSVTGEAGHICRDWTSTSHSMSQEMGKSKQTKKHGKKTANI